MLLPNYHKQRLWNSASAELVTLALGIRPERRFAPLARGKCFCYISNQLSNPEQRVYTRLLPTREQAVVRD